VILSAEGYLPAGKRPERIAAGRYLLETACGLPILVDNNRQPSKAGQIRPTVRRRRMRSTAQSTMRASSAP